MDNGLECDSCDFVLPADQVEEESLVEGDRCPECDEGCLEEPFNG